MAKIGDIVANRYEVMEISNKGIPTQYYDTHKKRQFYTSYGAMVRDHKVTGHVRRSKNGKVSNVKTHRRRNAK